MRKLIITATLFVFCNPVAALAQDSGNRPASKSLCYQGLCLGDPISKLNNRSLILERKEQNISLTPSLFKRAKEIYVANDQILSLLVKRGFVGTDDNANTAPSDTSEATLTALKGIKTLCDEPPKIVAAKVRASTDKQMTLVYVPTTMESGESVYGLFSIYIRYPELKSTGEMDEMMRKIRDTTGFSARCNQIGGGLECFDPYDSSTPWVKIKPSGIYPEGSVELTLKKNPFNLSTARNHPQCKADLKF